MKVKAKVTGAVDLEKFFKAMDPKTQRRMYRTMARAGGTVLRKEARRRLRGSRVTGNLHNSITVGRPKTSKNDVVFVDVGPDRNIAPHAHLVEFGTAERDTKVKGPRGAAAPHPFMRPAMDASHAQVHKAMAERMKKRLPIEVARALRKAGLA